MMKFAEVLLLDYFLGEKILAEKGYLIDKVTYLNQPPGVERIVRIKEKAGKCLELLVIYHHDLNVEI
ncbi:MAG: hypothetical protein ACOWWO_18485 [Peptococcaceae bacterium]